jgi:glutamate-1-semialdehyde 2,1-aminomutase
MPRNTLEADDAKDIPLTLLARVYLANRGVWEAIVGAGPTCSIPATQEDVDRYIGAFDSLIAEPTA